MFDKRPRTKRELKRLFTNLKRKIITDDMAHILIDLCYNKKQVMRTSGFYWPGGPDSVLFWDDITRRFTLSPRSPDPEGEGADTYIPQFRFYSWAGEPVFHRIYEELEIDIPDEEGRYVIFLDVDEETNQQSLFAKKNPDDNELARIIIKKVPVACLYWNQISQRAEVFCDDRFGSQINPQSHWIESSSTFAKRYADGGLAFYDYATNGDGTSESDLKFKVTPGKFWHGDFLIDVPRAGNETNIPTLHWSAGLPRILVSSVPVVRLERLAYNSGPNVVLAADSGKFVMYHIFATNDRVDGQHVVSVAGRAQYNSLGDAYVGREGELMTLHNEMPQSGKCYLGTFFYEVNSSFTNSAHARIVGVYSGDTHNPVSIAPGSEDYLSINDDQELSFDPSNLPSAGGADGREIELRENAGWIEWHYVGDSNWNQLFEIPEDGASSYLYVAYASDNAGSDWSLTPTDALKYRAEIHTTAPITPVESDFASAIWVKYIGDDGESGSGGSGTGATEVPELHLDFEEAGDEFTYTVPYSMKFTSQVSEVSDATLSIALNTILNRYDKLTITATAAGLVSLYGEYVED